MKPDLDRIAARTEDILEKDGYARTRFRGRAQRGQISGAMNDALDLRLAICELQDAVVELEKVDKIENEPGKRSLRGVAIGKVKAAATLLDSAVARISAVDTSRLILAEYREAIAELLGKLGLASRLINEALNRSAAKSKSKSKSKSTRSRLINEP